MANRRWVLGSDRDVDVLIREGAVSRRHCRLSLHGSQYFIEDLASRNGTFLGEKRIMTRTAIAAGAKVMLAGRIPMPWPDECLAEEIMRVGRAPANDVVMENTSVSSEHALVFRDPNGVWIVRDCHSTNGTRVNDGDPIYSSAVVAVDDVIRFGRVAETLGSLHRHARTNRERSHSGVTVDADTTKKIVWARSSSRSINRITVVVLGALLLILVIGGVILLRTSTPAPAADDRVPLSSIQHESVQPQSKA